MPAPPAPGPASNVPPPVSAAHAPAPVAPSPRPSPGRTGPTPDTSAPELDWLDGHLDPAGPDTGRAGTEQTDIGNGGADTGRQNRSRTDDDWSDQEPTRSGVGRPAPGPAGRARPPTDAAIEADPAGSGLGASSSTTTLTTADADFDGDRASGAGVDVVVDPLFSGTREIRTGRRADLRRQINEVRRLRTATVILLVLAVLGAPLGFYALREAARDPVFGDLAALEVPDWASRDVRDEATGSRWCIGQCRLRQRIMRSERTPQETSAVYTAALRKAGWITWPVDGCHSEDETSVESCWQRDEYVLDLWVYQPECEVQLKAPEDGQATVPQAEAVCPPTVVTIKVINRVGYQDKAGAKR